jgi:hypothetical protein
MNLIRWYVAVVCYVLRHVAEPLGCLFAPVLVTALLLPVVGLMALTWWAVVAAYRAS